MKALTTLLLTVLTYGMSFSQAFISLGSADAADATSSLGGDIKSVEYKIDAVQDSIWFKIESHNTLGDFCYYIFCDSDLNPNNGFSIDQPMSPPPHPSPNTSMKLDNRFMWVGRQGTFVTGEIEKWGSGGGSQSSPGNVQLINGTTVIVGGLLSDFDTLVSDVMMNVCVSSSGNGFFGGIIDYYPNNSHVLIPVTSTNVDVLDLGIFYVNAFPNPAKGVLNVAASETLVSLELVNSLGATVSQVVSRQIHTGQLPKGIYFLRAKSATGSTITKKIMIQ